MPYEIENVSRSMIYENLDTKDSSGKKEVLSVGVRAKVVLTDLQWASHSVQRHIARSRLRSKKMG